MSFATRYGPWAIVTGASAGIGAAFAESLARRGLNLVLVARREERLKDAARKLHQQHQVEVLPVAVDLLAEDAVDRIETAFAERTLGLLVNNAGFGLSGRFLEQDEQRLRAMVRLNCEVPTALASRFLPSLVQRGQGGMVVVSSVAGFLPTPWMSVYGATKGFDLLWGEALAVEMKPLGVDVEVLCPGSTESEFHELAGVGGDPAIGGGRARAEDVVELVLGRMGRQAAHVPGWRNRVVGFVTSRLMSRRAAAAASGRALGGRVPPHSPDTGPA